MVVAVVVVVTMLSSLAASTGYADNPYPVIKGT